MKSDIVPLKYMDKYWKKSFEDYEKSLVKKLSGITVVAHMPVKVCKLNLLAIIETWFLKKAKIIWLFLNFNTQD